MSGKVQSDLPHAQRYLGLNPRNPVAWQPAEQKALLHPKPTLGAQGEITRAPEQQALGISQPGTTARHHTSAILQQHSSFPGHVT